MFSSGFRSKIGNFEQFFRQKLEISSDFRENVFNLEQYSVISSGLKGIDVPQSNYWRGHVSPRLIVHFLHTFSTEGPLVGPKVVEWWVQIKDVLMPKIASTGLHRSLV